MNNNPLQKSAELADEENRQNIERRSKLGKITKEIEEIFIREKFTMGDLLEVFGLFMERANKVFGRKNISDIKKDYEQN